MTEHSFHGINTSRPKAKSVTHVSGTICHLSLRPLTVVQPKAIPKRIEPKHAAEIVLHDDFWRYPGGGWHDCRGLDHGADGLDRRINADCQIGIDRLLKTWRRSAKSVVRDPTRTSRRHCARIDVGQSTADALN